jgi:hypothetical protein
VSWAIEGSELFSHFLKYGRTSLNPQPSFPMKDRKQYVSNVVFVAALVQSYVFHVVANVHACFEKLMHLSSSRIINIFL